MLLILGMTQEEQTLKILEEVRKLSAKHVEAMTAVSAALSKLNMAIDETLKTTKAAIGTSTDLNLYLISVLSDRPDA